MLGSSCCCNCPGLIPYRFNSETQQYEDYDIPEEVEVDVSFQLPQDELWIETRKSCCSDLPTLSFGRKYKRPSSGTYSLSRGTGYRYEYVSRDLILRVDLSSQYSIDTASPFYACSPWAYMLISFGTHAEISREGSEFDPVSPVTDAELTAALSRSPKAWNPGSYTDLELTRYCRKSTPVSGGCGVGEWNELYQTPLYPSGIQPDQGWANNLQSVRLPQSANVPLTVDLQVPAIDVTPGQLNNGFSVLLTDIGLRVLGTPACWYIGPPCYEIFDPDDPNYAGYAQAGTRLAGRVLQVNGAGKKSLPGTITINSVKAKRTGAPDISVFDMPAV